MLTDVKTFRLYPERGDKRFYRVHVFRTAKLMYAYWDERRERRPIEYKPGFERSLTHDFAAIIIGYDDYKIRRGQETKTNNIGEILIHDDYIGAAVVAHEMTHAAHFWLERLGLSVHDLEDEALEERFCEVVGQLCRTFWTKYFQWQHEKETAAA